MVFKAYRKAVCRKCQERRGSKKNNCSVKNLSRRPHKNAMMGTLLLFSKNTPFKLYICIFALIRNHDALEKIHFFYFGVKKQY